MVGSHCRQSDATRWSAGWIRDSEAPANVARQLVLDFVVTRDGLGFDPVRAEPDRVTPSLPQQIALIRGEVAD